MSCVLDQLLNEHKAQEFLASPLQVLDLSLFQARCRGDPGRVTHWHQIRRPRSSCIFATRTRLPPFASRQTSCCNLLQTKTIEISQQRLTIDFFVSYGRVRETNLDVPPLRPTASDASTHYFFYSAFATSNEIFQCSRHGPVPTPSLSHCLDIVLVSNVTVILGLTTT